MNINLFLTLAAITMAAIPNGQQQKTENIDKPKLLGGGDPVATNCGDNPSY